MENKKLAHEERDALELMAKGAEKLLAIRAAKKRARKRRRPKCSAAANIEGVYDAK